MKIFNTINRKKEEFKSIENKVVTMYVCGPTVYDLFHIGNARTFVFFDVVRNYFEYKGYEVKYIQNFTDIDDKIINKAKESGVSISEISEKYIKEYYEDADKLNIKRATLNPKATENIIDMIKLIENLIEKDFAYVVNGNVYFSINSFVGYGKLFGQDINTLKYGSRIEVNKEKKYPLDFILWKKSDENEVGYDAPWGRGRPGWHTECCAMIHKYFDGRTIDIHCGGFDLIFPHHENEIAQIEVLTKKPLANYWMHCYFLNIDNQKMSKSLKNFFTAREILEKYSSNVFRFFILSAHYRNELCFSEDQLIWAEKSLDRIYKCYESINEKLNVSFMNEKEEHLDELLDFEKRFIERMDDDFNTSDSISIIFEFIKYINLNLNNFSKSECVYSRDKLEELFGILGINLREFIDEDIELNDLIREKILRRYDMKRNKEFDLADLIRSELLECGILLEDIRGGVRVLNIKSGALIETIFY